MPKFRLGDMCYASKKQAVHDVRRILAESLPGAPLVGRDAAIIMDLLRRHPNAEEKLERGIAGLTVRDFQWLPGKSHRCFWIVHPDGTETDFSYRVALGIAASVPTLQQAAREAVREQMHAFKRSAFGKAEAITCAVTGRPITWICAHVDHAPPWPFSRILVCFIAEHGAASLKDCPDNHVSFSDPSVVAAFVRFHDARANLRVVHAKWNISQGARQSQTGPVKKSTSNGGWLLRECEDRVASAPRGEADLRAYQSGIIVPFLLDHPKSAAYVGMGMGKSSCVLTVLDRLFAAGQAHRALIIAPKRVAVQTWPTELAEWRHTLWMRHVLIRAGVTVGEVASGALRREEAARSDAPIHIVNREQVKWLVEFHGKAWPYDVVIVDESTSFADHTSQRWKALARVAARTPRLHLLSGTPAPEGIMDLFAQIYLLDAGKRFGRGVTAFQTKYMMQNPYTRKWLPQSGAAERVSELIADICLVMREEDYLDNPEPLVTERPIILEPSELKQYKAFQRELLLSLPDGTEIEAVNAGVLAGKLLQYASGAVLDQDRRYHVVHGHKIEELRQLVDETPGEPLLVAYWFRSSLDRLRKAFPKATVMDKDAACVKAWNAGKLPMLFVHPQSAGHGLNMQLGPGHRLVFFDTPASLELYMQVIKRIARQGQKKRVVVTHLVARGTIEAYAVPKLRGKESAQEALTTRLRELRASFSREAAAAG